MKIWKQTVLFYLGGMGYCGLELLWRGRSHGSMFVLGGLCFLSLGRIGRMKAPFWVKAALGCLFITAGELVTGLLVNRRYEVWDYRYLKPNYHGQVCLLYSLLWLVLSPIGWNIHRFFSQKLPN